MLLLLSHFSRVRLFVTLLHCRQILYHLSHTGNAKGRDIVMNKISQSPAFMMSILQRGVCVCALACAR